MKRCIQAIVLVLLLVGCEGRQFSDIPDGYWEGVAVLDGVGFFVGITSKDGQFFADIPEMMIKDAYLHGNVDRAQRLSLTLPLGTSELRMLLQQEEGTLVGKIMFDSTVGAATLYPGEYRRAYRMASSPPREGEEVSFDTPFGTVRGTLLMPHGDFGITAVLLIAGSGPTDRDGNSEIVVANNNMSWHVARELLQEDIASLRYDKMGVGESLFEDHADAHDFTFEDSVTVVRLLVSSLRENPKIGKLGIICHSEGSQTGLQAAQDAEVDFFISIAGNGDPIDSQLVSQVKRVSPDAALVVEKRLRQISRGQYEKTGNALVDALIPEGSESYLASWMKFDPSMLLRTISIPTLVIKGDRDERLVAEEDWFMQSGMPDHVQFKIIPGMGHVLKEVHSPEDIVRSYQDGSMPVHPALLEAIKTFISNQ